MEDLYSPAETICFEVHSEFFHELKQWTGSKLIFTRVNWWFGECNLTQWSPFTRMPLAPPIAEVQLTNQMKVRTRLTNTASIYLSNSQSVRGNLCPMSKFTKLCKCDRRKTKCPHKSKIDKRNRLTNCLFLWLKDKIKLQSPNGALTRHLHLHLLQQLN